MKQTFSTYPPDYALVASGNRLLSRVYTGVCSSRFKQKNLKNYAWIDISREMYLSKFEVQSLYNSIDWPQEQARGRVLIKAESVWNIEIKTTKLK